MAVFAENLLLSKTKMKRRQLSRQKGTVLQYNTLIQYNTLYFNFTEKVTVSHYNKYIVYKGKSNEIQVCLERKNSLNSCLRYFSLFDMQMKWVLWTVNKLTQFVTSSD